ncbi:MAG: response regulator [Elusimicrobia bacterium]|nr:response regulator [Elusimicrobiota bacterium]
MHITGPKVLAIDDDTDYLDILRAAISGLFPGATVFTGIGGKQGLALALANDPDVILLDITMPDMDGYEVCRRLKRDGRLKNIPVVFVTAAHVEKESRIKALEAGGDGFLAKPFDTEELSAQIRAMTKIKAANTSGKLTREHLEILVQRHTADLKKELAERIRADSELLESRQLLNGIINSLPVRVFWKNRDLVYLGCNALFAQDAGLAGPEEIVGKDDRQLVWREQAQLYRDGDRRVIESGRPKLLIEESQTTPSGETISLLTSKIPLRDSGGNIIGVLGVYMDISARKMAEEALREAFEMQGALNSMMQRSLAGITLREKLDGHLAALFTLPKLPLQPKGAVFLTAPRGDAVSLAAQQGLSAATQAAFSEIPLEHFICGKAAAGGLSAETSAPGPDHDAFCKESGSHRHYCAHISAGGEILGVLVLYLKDGGALTDSQRRFVGSATDIMAENILHARTEARLAQSQRLESVGRLAGGVAHDFNNILTAIRGYTEFILKGLDEQDPKTEDVREIITAADRASSLTRQLLAFSRRQVMTSKAADLNKCVGDITNMLRRLIGEDIKLATKLAPVPCTAFLDVGQIEQVLVNLVVNARDAMPGGGQIELSTELLAASAELAQAHPELPHGPLVCLKVSDTGCGMTDEVKKHLFEPFFTTKERGKGTGLGLSTVFGIVKQIGGDIEVESEPGAGAVFRIYFPLFEARDAGAAAGAQGAAGAGAVGTETILLVEDEESLRRLGRRILVSSGYTVLEAAGGAEALRALELHGKPVDLLLTDVIMPGMSGRDLAREIARKGLAPRTLYMSGYTDDAIVKHGVLETGLSFIYKPFTVDALSLKVRTVLDAPADQSAA